MTNQNINSSRWPVLMALCIATLCCQTVIAQQSPSLQAKKLDDGIQEITRAIEASPRQAQLYRARGGMFFRSGKIEESIKDFDRCIELQPSLEPELWERGISLYYAGRYEDGRSQFEVHRTVNPNDVENAFWHFLCAAKLDGLEAAQKSVLLSGFDRRFPLMQVQELIQGKIKPEDVAQAIEKVTSDPRSKQSARFYGYLYLGLYFDAINDEANALKHLQLSVDEKVDGYMGDVARFHLAKLKDQAALRR